MKRSIVRKARGALLAGLMVALSTPVLPLQAQAMGAGTETVRSLYDTLLATMRSGQTLGARGRYAQLEPMVRRVFDIPLMTRMAVGPEWASLDDTQRQQLQQAFERYIAAIYAERFDSYAGEQMQVTGEQASANGTIITSQIVKSNGEPVNVNYLVRNNGGVWQIADVYVDGSISELATRRSEFASILRVGGINGLIQTLNTKATALTSRTL